MMHDGNQELSDVEESDADDTDDDGSDADDTDDQDNQAAQDNPENPAALSESDSESDDASDASEASDSDIDPIGEPAAQIPIEPTDQHAEFKNQITEFETHIIRYLAEHDQDVTHREINTLKNIIGDFRRKLQF